VIENAVPHAGQVRRVRGLQPGQSGRGQRYADSPGVGWAARLADEPAGGQFIDEARGPASGQVHAVGELRDPKPDPAPFFAEYGNNSWAIFKAYLDAAAAKVASPVIAKYLGRLAAADVFTADNAYVMFEALRVDYATLGPFGDHP
jgi:hypothetical protein